MVVVTTVVARSSSPTGTAAGQAELSVGGRSVLVVELLEAVTDPGAVEPWRLADADLLALTVELTTHLHRVEALRLRLLADADRRGSAVATGAASTGRWLAGATRTSPGAATRLVALARDLHRVPATAAALGTGEVSVEHAREVVAALGQLPTTLDDATRQACEHALLTTALLDDPLAVRRTGLELLVRAQSDALEDVEERAVARRELRIAPSPVDGMVRLTGHLDAEGAETLLAALSPLAAPEPGHDGTPDPRTSSRRAADALVTLARRALDAGAVGVEACVRPHVTLTVDAGTLATGHGPLPQLTHLGAVSDGAARRISCDAEVTRTTLDGEGVPLDVGRTTRLVTGGLRRALVARDQGCAFPGCGRPPSWCEAHHVVHWCDGGVTALANLVLLCGHHHRAVHHRGWDVWWGADRHPWFRPPAWVDPERRPRPSHARRHAVVAA